MHGLDVTGYHVTNLVALLIATIWLLARRRPSGYAGEWFFLILAPTSSLLPLPMEIATERRMYLPLMAIVALLTLGLYRLVSRFVANRAPLVASLVLAPILCAEVVRTVLRNQMYMDPVALWTDLIQRRPMNPRAYDNLAYAYMSTPGHEQWDRAREALLRAIELDPADHIARNNLARVYIHEGNDAAAIDRLHAALRVRPDYPTAHFNLGRIAYDHGDYAAAERELREALRLLPDPDNHVLLSKTLTALGKTAEAEDLARAAIRLDPASASAHDALALALARGGKPREALKDAEREVREAIRLDGDRADRSALLRQIQNARRSSPTSLPASSSPSPPRP